MTRPILPLGRYDERAMSRALKELGESTTITRSEQAAILEHAPDALRRRRVEQFVPALAAAGAALTLALTAWGLHVLGLDGSLRAVYGASIVGSVFLTGLSAFSCMTGLRDSATGPFLARFVHELRHPPKAPEPPIIWETSEAGVGPHREHLTIQEKS